MNEKPNLNMRKIKNRISGVLLGYGIFFGLNAVLAFIINDNYTTSQFLGAMLGWGMGAFGVVMWVLLLGVALAFIFAGQLNNLIQVAQNTEEMANKAKARQNK